MNVYDFDNTIYNGESALHFFWFCLKKKPVLLKVLFPILRDLVRYKRCRMSKEEFKNRGAYYTESFFNLFDDIYAVIDEFWDRNEHKIRNFYFRIKRDDDVIVTANIDVLVDVIFRRMGVKNYIATHFDMNTGKLGEVCFGEVKAKLFKEKYGDNIDKFFTDSYNDKPLMDMANEVYMVKRGVIEKLEKRDVMSV